MLLSINNLLESFNVDWNHFPPILT